MIPHSRKCGELRGVRRASELLPLEDQILLKNEGPFKTITEGADSA